MSAPESTAPERSGLVLVSLILVAAVANLNLSALRPGKRSGDVIIIGWGFGGSVAALQAVEKG